jgi:RHS repeat-associated protein
VTTFDYDALNRVKTKTYTDGTLQPGELSTPNVSYTYDEATVPYSKGRLTQMSSGPATVKILGYDALGRVTRSEQQTDGASYRFQGPSATAGYEYNLADGLKKYYLPTGRLVETEYTLGGKVSKVKGNATTFADALAFSAAGLPTGSRYGEMLTETTTYNSRLQMATRTAVRQPGTVQQWAFENDYGSTQNNGNVQWQKVLSGGRILKQNFGYDGANRLTSANEVEDIQALPQVWTQTYNYDVYGNRWVTGSSGVGLTYDAMEPTASVSHMATANRLSASSTYDAAGNPLSYGAGTTVNWDAEGRMTRLKKGVDTTGTLDDDEEMYFYYDGEGRRVKKEWRPNPGAGWQTTVYVYDAFGDLAAEYATNAPAGPSGISHRLTDHLGSTRAVTDSAGNVRTRFDYTPFGRLLRADGTYRVEANGYEVTPTSRPTMKFTGKERDAETGLDYFGARYYSGSQGRFTNPDQVLIDQDPSDPQSWNLYSYVRNNPLRFIDPSGRACVWNNGSWENDNSGGQSCSDVDKENKKLKPSATVTVALDELKLMMLQSVGRNMGSPRQWAEVTRHGMEGAMAVEGIAALPSAFRGLRNMVGLWRATRLVPASLETLATAGGPTIEVVTSQTRALDAARGLSTAVGEGAAAFAKSFQPGGTLSTAKIPEALIRGLQSRGWAQTFTHSQGTELYFTPEAMPYVLRFFQ